MKFTALIILIATLHVSARTFSQNVTITGRDLSLTRIFTLIGKQTGYEFLYDPELLKNASPVTIDMRDEPLAEALKICFKDQHLNYFIKYNTIVVLAAIDQPADLSIIESPPPPIDIHGRITDSTGKALQGATILVKGTRRVATTDESGVFFLKGINPNSTLVVSYIGYDTRELTVKGKTDMVFILRVAASQLNEVEVALSTGYQNVAKERATGSFAQVDNQLFNRRVSTDVVSRLEGVVPGLLFNRNTVSSAAGMGDISIRGHSTLFANDQPLYVVDNFPYDGDINNLNPNDIESITVLKDAAAASIWGVRSGNGVIVITTKKGKRNQRLSSELNANVTVGKKPDLFYSPSFIASNDFIDIEQDLFSRGYYDGDLSSSYHSPVTPVVQILADQRAGLISAAEATDQINAYRNLDIRKDESKYLYQRAVNQQYAVNIKGGGNSSDYFFSLGDDRDRSSSVGNQNNRVTLNSLLNFYPVKNLQISGGIDYVQSSSTNNSILNTSSGLTLGYKGIYPYEQLADAKGNALAIPKDFALSYIDTAGNGQYLDWNYRPLDEQKNADNTTKLVDNRINLGIKYSFLKGFSLDIKYQYEHASTNTQDYYSMATYHTRYLINEFTQVSPTGILSYPVPLGGILQTSNNYLTSKRGRGQLNYNGIWHQKHELAAILGTEISESVNEGDQNTAYGYDKSTGNSYNNIDYSSTFSNYLAYSQRIPTSLGFGKTTDRYLSYFGNAAYTYNGRYTLSVSGRVDKSNLFGVSTNQKAVPLFSMGLAWELNKESFYHLSWLPYARLRATYGYTGNIDKSATAVTTIRQWSDNYFSGTAYASIANPGNPDLRWERMRMINFALDYAFKNRVLSGSLEYYLKKGIDIFGNSPLAPSSGQATFFGNNANTAGKGFDIVINTRNIDGKRWKWTSNFMISRAFDKVTKYGLTLAPYRYIFSSNANSSSYPFVGKPIYGVYSYRWEGLDPATGDPQGYINGKTSEDYAAIITKTSLDSIVYNGPARPTVFGSFRNTFSYKQLSLSFNIIYKFGYYFRRNSYTSSYLPWSGHKDYYKRWQNPGDELKTNVPSLQYPPYDNDRDLFYEYSSTLVDKGDHIRLQDITLSYDMDKAKWGRLPFAHAQVYGYINNVVLLWKANHDGLDPDLSGNYSLALPLPRTYALGLKLNF